MAFVGCGTDPGARIDPESVVPPPAAAVTPYDPAFAFKQPIPDDAPTDPRSDAIISQLVENITRERVQLSPTADVPPVYVARPDDPFFTVGVTGVDARFRVPADARPGDGDDFPLVILDPDHPTFGRQVELRLWQATIDRENRRIDASGAGLFHYNNDGRRLNPDASPSAAAPFQGQGTGSDLSILAGLIRPEEVQAGAIHHAIRMVYSRNDFVNTFRAPAIKTDQPFRTETRNPATAMEMGMRLQLDPSVNCNDRTVPERDNSSPQTRFLRIVCHALQDYGAIVSDGSATDAVGLQMEHDATADWDELVGEPRFDSYGYVVRDDAGLDDELDRDSRSGIPWSRMRVLESSEFDTIGPVGRTE